MSAWFGLQSLAYSLLQSVQLVVLCVSSPSPVTTTRTPLTTPPRFIPVSSLFMPSCLTVYDDAGGVLISFQRLTNPCFSLRLVPLTSSFAMSETSKGFFQSYILRVPQFAHTNSLLSIDMTASREMERGRGTGETHQGLSSMPIDFLPVAFVIASLLQAQEKERETFERRSEK